MHLDFFRYCGVFRYFEGSETLNRAFGGQNLSTIAGFSVILTFAIAEFYCTIDLKKCLLFLIQLTLPRSLLKSIRVMACGSRYPFSKTFHIRQKVNPFESMANSI